MKTNLTPLPIGEGLGERIRKENNKKNINKNYKYEEKTFSLGINTCPNSVIHISRRFG